MAKQIKFGLIATVAVCLWSGFVFAATIPVQNQFTYSFHLYYDHGQLFADRDFQFKYDLIAGPFTQGVIKTAVPYHGEIINVKNKAEASFDFDPQDGNAKFVVGKITVKAPYFADASKAVFYNNKNKLLLTLDVSGSSFCNDNNVCDSNVGEDYLNCPNDCKVPVTSTTTSAMPGWLWIVGAVVLIAVLIIWIIIKRKRKQVQISEIPTIGNLPPVVPPSPPTQQQ